MLIKCPHCKINSDSSQFEVLPEDEAVKVCPPEIPKAPTALKSLELVWDERIRQQTEEGYTPAHDDEHTEGQLALLAAAYALSSRGKYKRTVEIHSVLALDGFSFKPKDPISDVIKAAALLLAELERLLRAEERKKMSENTVQLPRWQSHKIVAADKIVHVLFSRGFPDRWELACGVIVGVSEDLKMRGDEFPVGGYYIRYEDGFESWSPMKAFEEGYTRLPILYQLHHEFKDGTTDMCAQKEWVDGPDFERFLTEVKASHPLPEGAQWLVVPEDSPRFWRVPV
jgi:hypothetical protein